MKKIILLALMCVLAPLAGRAQTTVSGNLRDVGVANASGSNTYVRFTLLDYGAQIPKITNLSGNLIFNPIKDFKPDANGIISGTIQGNDTITPPATKYQVCVYYQGAVFRCNTYIINGATFNLNTATPLNTSVQVGANQLVVLSYPFTQATPASTWTIPHNFNDPNSYVQVFDTVHRIIYPDRVDTSDPNNAVLTFVTPTPGFAIAMHAGAINIATNQPNAIISNPVAAQTIGGQPTTFQGPTNFTNTLAAVNAGIFDNTATRAYISSALNGCDPTVEIGGNANATQAITGCVKVPVGATNNNSAAVAGFANSSADSASGTHGNAVGGYFAGVAHGNNAFVEGSNLIAADIPGLTGHWITGNEIDVGVSPTSVPAFVRGIVITSNQSPGVMANSIGIELNPRPGGFSWGSGIMLDRGVSGNGLLLDGQDFGGNNRSQTVAFIGYNSSNLPKVSSINGTANGDLQLQPSTGNAYFAIAGGGGFQLPGSTSGTNTLIAPAVAGSTTTTLPAAGGTLLTTGNGAGNLIQTARVAGCTTSGGATPFTGPCTITVPWPNAFADGNYTVTCTGNGVGAGVPLLQATTTITGASTLVQTQQATGVNASFVNIECTAIHD